MDSQVRKSMRASLGNLLLVLALVVSGCGAAGKDLPSPAGGPDGGEPAPAAASANDTPSPASADGPAVEGLPPEPMKVTVPIPNPNIAHGEVLLSRSRYYRLDVETVDKTVLLSLIHI